MSASVRAGSPTPLNPHRARKTLAAEPAFFRSTTSQPVSQPASRHRAIAVTLGASRRVLRSPAPFALSSASAATASAAASASLDDEEREEFERAVRPVKMVLVKIRRLAFKIVHSTTLIKPAWEAILSELGLGLRLIPCDVKTRWNSTFDMLRTALDYKTALDTLCSRREHGLRAFELTSEEWGIAQELCDTLKIFKDATLFFSRDTPNLAMVIPAMDHIDTYLTNCTRAGHALSEPISSSLRTAKKTLNRYYKLSDMSATYRIAMGKFLSAFFECSRQTHVLP
ncbi:hypothetical protein NUW54_g14065 [Trametes sanguinea]|uniref:Uncharacterized protein n=1 Tax=Trametes sanguinea TaxID=158606 RepID=A0ACC1MF18_9APHY|nr:hypothetical protein NUW54_g14065 [Trametes sanguinea]